MKKIYLLIAIMSLSLAGCGTADNSSDKKAQTTDKSTESTMNIAATTNTNDSTTETTNPVNENSSSATSKNPTQEQSQNTTSSQSQEQATSTTQPTTEQLTTQPQAQTPTTTQPQTQAPTATQPQIQTPTTTQPQTQAPTTTQPQTQAPTQPATEATTSKYFVDYTEELSTVTENYKYGLKKLINTYNYYIVYSDGSKEKYDTYSYNSYDTSGYRATDAELLDESNSKAAANISYYNEVLALVNEIRAEVGVAPLTLDTTLCQAATMRAVEMNYSDLFSHTRPNGADCFTVLNTYSISYGSCGENIAAGYNSPSAVVTGWKNSPGHYANMINSRYTKLGVGLSNEEPGTYGKYWVQLFTN